MVEEDKENDQSGSMAAIINPYGCGCAAKAKLAALQEAVEVVIKNTITYHGDHEWDALKAAFAKSKEDITP